MRLVFNGGFSRDICYFRMSSVNLLHWTPDNFIDLISCKKPYHLHVFCERIFLLSQRNFALATLMLGEIRNTQYEFVSIEIYK